MATSSGKKGKKASKKNKVSLGEFLTDGNATPVSQVQVAVPLKLRDWADECDDDEDDRPTRTQMIALPTAPRATRLLNDDTIPHNPPYLAYISNLPYDLNDDDLYNFFDGMEITSLRLPRDDNDSGRLRGFGYIEFGRRQDLIDALSIPEPVIHSRRIRIDLSSENDQKRSQRNNRNYDNYGGDSDRPMGNWRDGPRTNVDRDQGQRRPYNNYNRDRGDRDNERYPDSGSGGNWRSGDRPVQPPPDSPTSNRRNYDRGDRGDRGFRRGGDRSGDRGGRREMEPPMERPKLIMKPRTLPLPEKPKPEPEDSERDASRERQSNSGNEASEDKENQKIEPRPKPTPVPAAKVFGDAKPVDTAARLKEIEERMLEKQRLEKEERQQKAAAAAAAAAASSAAVTSSGDEDGKEKTDPSKDETDVHSEGKTEKKPEEVTNWRVRTDDKDLDRRGQSPPRRYSPTRKYNRRPDNYNFSDNRDNRDDRRPMNRDNRNRRDYNRPNDRGYRLNDRDHDMNRGGGRDNRDDRDRRENVRPVEREKENDPKPIEERMPKFHEPEGPNLSVKNTFEGLSADEIDD
ncbi:eukaryotic translation initiation factor 4B [Malaya genurostris]|uniref:eukaryotic translation initiation factor 4B n=1 Tax=Malaya genurostris TaxID=325434 RepID=UPI0026F40367|nr:eukaryotic translation initiation factor 4B [Malaya genurostris]